MKRILLSIVLLLAGMAAYAQDLSYYSMEYLHPEGSFADRLRVLRLMQEEKVAGTPEFYLQALTFLNERAPDHINNRIEQGAAEQAVVILATALGEAKHGPAANELLRAFEWFDVIQTEHKQPNEGNAMRAAAIALAEVDARQYIPQIVKRLTDFNTQRYSNAEIRRRVQAGVLGCVRALEIFKDESGYRPVFFVYQGGYDASVKQQRTPPFL